MFRSLAPRTETLIRIHLALLTISLVLCAMLVYRHFPHAFAPGDPIGIAPTNVREAPGPHAPSGPAINWGGQRR